MKFWDTSALAPLLVAEPGSERREAQLRDDPVLAVWYGTPVELESALSRRRREGRRPGMAAWMAFGQHGWLRQQGSQGEGIACGIGPCPMKGALGLRKVGGRSIHRGSPDATG